MTIKELYEMAVEQNVENLDYYIYDADYGDIVLASGGLMLHKKEQDTFLEIY